MFPWFFANEHAESREKFPEEASWAVPGTTSLFIPHLKVKILYHLLRSSVGQECAGVLDSGCCSDRLEFPCTARAFCTSGSVVTADML